MVNKLVEADLSEVEQKLLESKVLRYLDSYPVEVRVSQDHHSMYTVQLRYAESIQTIRASLDSPIHILLDTTLRYWGLL